MGAKAMHGDCVEAMRAMEDGCVDAIVTDPPAGISFMGKAWDGDKGGRDQWVAWMQAVAAEALRVAKPGAHALVWALPRTSHWTATAWENAGWEVRDRVAHLFGTGFPKSLDVSKQLDFQEKNRWLDVCKAIDNLNHADILGAWKERSNSAKLAELIFQRSAIETGTNTPRSVSVPASVRLSVSPARSHASAVIAELNSSAALRMNGGIWLSAQSSADASTTALSAHVIIAEHSPGSREVMRDMTGSSAQCSALDFPGASISLMDKAVEALKIWLGSKQSSRREATTALCAELTDALKLITLSQSETFRSLDTKSQTAFASATTATITEYTAASLISYTVGILRNKAIDKAAGAERAEIGPRVYADGTTGHWATGGVYADDAHTETLKVSGAVKMDTAPATPEAQRWAGWGTALKPACEDWWLLRKPLIGTVAANVLAHGTGALNIDATRVPNGSGQRRASATSQGGSRSSHEDNKAYTSVLREVCQKCRTECSGNPTSPEDQLASSTDLPSSAFERECGYQQSPNSRDDYLICPRCGGEHARGPEGRGQSLSQQRVDADTARDLHGERGHSREDLSKAYEDYTTQDVQRQGRWPANVVHSGDDEVLSAFAAFGESRSRAGQPRGSAKPGDGWGMTRTGAEYSDEGSPARFFQACPFDEGEGARFHYSSKANARDRAGSKHPTVKPLSLMKYLVKLITPPGGTVLDMFAGSGTTLQAALEEGFHAIGIEREADYHADILRRLEMMRERPAPKAGKPRPGRPKDAARDPPPDLLDFVRGDTA